MSGGGFLTRWSRRKRAAGEALDPDRAGRGDEADAPDCVGPGDADPDDAAADDAAADEAELAALPPVETITAETDITGFLRRGVPPLLRQAALRRMWRVNPAIRDYVDDAREYAFDWNAPGGVPGGGLLSQDEAGAIVARIFGPQPERRASQVAATPEAATTGPADAKGDTPADAAGEPASAPPPSAQPDTGRKPAAARRHGAATPETPPDDDA